ncbi:MAG: hypothetical protein ACK2U9_12980, partial [Anaerolineae bacterium]
YLVLGSVVPISQCHDLPPVLSVLIAGILPQIQPAAKSFTPRRRIDFGGNSPGLVFASEGASAEAKQSPL